MPASLEHFARVSDEVASLPGKLKKQATLAGFFRSLDDADLRRAVRFSMGRAFPRTAERVLGVSGAIVSSAILELFPEDATAYRDLVTTSGEVGEAMATLVARHGPRAPADASPLSLADLEASFESLASVGGMESKRSITRSLLARCRTPREAAYACKIILGDLRTGAIEGVIQAAVAETFGAALEQIHRAQLMVGDLDEVAVLARHNQLGSAVFRLFSPVQFMLATPQETSVDAAASMAGRYFWAEHKLDGIRAQVHRSADRIAIYTRTMDRTDESFPEVVDVMSRIGGQFVLDGEIVPMKAGQIQPFSSIQKRLGRKALTPNLLRDHPAVFVAFDILYRDGTSYFDIPLRARRAVLEDLVRASAAQPDRADYPLLSITDFQEIGTAEEIDAAFAAARDARNEGLVLKDPDSIYTPGRRGSAWLKIKSHLPTLDCVVTTAELGHGKRRGVLSDYTFAVWDAGRAGGESRLVNIGKAYSGLTDGEIFKLTDLFRQITIAQRGSVSVVQPQVVLEIAFDQVTRSTRHAGGYALRFPRIKRIRWDKKIEDADRLSRVEEIFRSDSNLGRTDAAPEPTLFDQLR